MRIFFTFCASMLLVAACGDNSSEDPGFSGPYDDVPLTETLRVSGLSAPVDVVRDRYGMPHIHAQNVADLAFASGYVQAEDRLQQMDLFRRYASGTLSELFGALDPGQVHADLEMRMHRMRPLAEASWQELVRSSDPEDQELVVFLQRFADGVNHYAEDLSAGLRTLDPAQAFFFDVTRFVPWTPVDTLVIGRLQAFFLSFDDGLKLALTESLERSRAVFDSADPEADPELARRTGAAHDLYPLRPMDLTSAIEGFPGIAAAAGAHAPRAAARPSPDPALLAAARQAMTPSTELGRRLRDELNGSNAWIVAPHLTGGRPMLANDPHLSLSSPSIFYLSHLTIPGDLDVTGITFPGIPGIVLGHNRDVAWGSTTVRHDVTDYYLEEIVPCAESEGDCVRFQDGEVPLQTWQETVRVGALGTITHSETVTYEYVPHHGPIIPTVADGTITPRSQDTAISVRYTGHQATTELRAFQKLWRARDRAEAFAALEHFSFGAQNWMIIDSQGSIGWSSHALVPWRSPGCFTFHATEAPDGVAPFLLLPGDGTCEWEGWMDPRHIPHAIDPERGFVVTANEDPVGQTFDGDPLGGPIVDGRPLYVGAYYAEGMRAGRVTRRLEARIDDGLPLTVDDMLDIQGDTHSNLGERMQPHLAAAALALAEELGAPGSHPDLEAWVASLSVERQQALTEAGSRLGAWTLATPAAVGDAVSEQAIRDSVATSIFNGWVVHFLRATFADELERIQASPWTQHARAALALLERPGDLHTGLAQETGQPILCDDLDTPDTVESCTLIILMALDETLAWARGPGFGTEDMDEWRWGRLHTLTLTHLLPIPELSIPPQDDANPLLRNGYPRPGDGYSVDASHPGYHDLDFRYQHGPAMRRVTEFVDGQPRTLVAIPGGQSSHRDSEHFRDLMDEYWAGNQYFQMPWTVEEIIAAASSRRRFEPAE